MAPTSQSSKKAAPKPAKKDSKLASLKSAIFGASKKPQVAAPQSKAGQAMKSGKSDVKPMDKKAGDKKGAKAPATAPAAKAVVGKKGALPAAAPKGAAPGKGAPQVNEQAAKPALTKGKKVPAKKKPDEQDLIPQAGPSIRISYDANGEAVCREVACEGLSTSSGYCRMHYIKNWKKIKRKDLILQEGKLNQYIEELVAKYPDKYIEAIRQDLANDKDFAKVIYDLDLDESVDDFEGDGESLEAVIDTIKRDFDDDGDSGF